MRNSKIKSMTIDAMFLAILALMTFIPQIGFISLGGVISFTLLHIVVLIGAGLGGTKKGLIYGIMFGCLSLIKAATSGTGIFDPYFVNPLISILPRAIFGLIAGLLFDLVNKLNLRTIRVTATIIISFVTTMLHSLMVLGMLGLFNASELTEVSQQNYWLVMGGILGSSSIVEAIAASIIVSPVLVALNPKILNLKKNESIKTED